MVWSRRRQPDRATVLASYPGDTPAVGTEVPVIGDVPQTLSAHDAPAQSFPLDEDLYLTVVSGDESRGRNFPEILDEVGRLARLEDESRYNHSEVERLRAVVNSLQDGVVTLDPNHAYARVNTAAAGLLGVPRGRNPASVFDGAFARMVDKALNKDEIAVALKVLESEPDSPLELKMRFAELPTHLTVVSQLVHYEGLDGRTWVFYDESKLSQALEASERSKALLQASSDGMLDPQVLFEAVRDPSGRITDFVYREVNNSACHYIGMRREDMIGNSAIATMPNLARSGLFERYAECADTGRPQIINDFGYLNDTLGPRRFDIRLNGAGVDTISVTWRDITERFEAIEQIAASEERFRLLAENASDVVMHVRDGVIAWVSPSVEEVLGAPAADWVGRRLLDIIPEEDRQAADKVTWLTKDRARIPRGRIIGADGTTHWIDVHAQSFYGAEGRQDGYTAAFRVIDDEVRAVEEAEEARRQEAVAQARYRNLMDNAAVGMGVIEPDGHLEEVNQAACDFFGYDAAALKQMTWQELTAPEYLEADLANVESMAAGRIDSFRSTKQFIHADGHLIWGALSVGCLRGPNGELDRMIAQVTDITAEVETRQYLARRDEQNRILTARLQAQTDRLGAELRSAADYVESILPTSLDGPVRVSSRYLPSRELGGDCFDYRWIDDDHLITYVIDVSGHGIEASLVSISIHNLLRSTSLPTADLLDPRAVMTKLNSIFTMERHGENYLTAWYGVYERSTRTLRYASAGHPPALLISPRDGYAQVKQLATGGVPAGMFDDSEYTCATSVVPTGSQLLMYSDGAYEIPTPTGKHWGRDEFVELCTQLASAPEWSLQTLLGRLETQAHGGAFEDDCSLVLLTFS